MIKFLNVFVHILLSLFFVKCNLKQKGNMMNRGNNFSSSFKTHLIEVDHDLLLPQINLRLKDTKIENELE